MAAWRRLFSKGESPVLLPHVMDPVLTVLGEKALRRSQIDDVCALLDEVEAKDVYAAFEILCKLQKYLGETQSWSFTLLATHDFEGEGNKFELNLANMVGDRAQMLLNHIRHWDLAALKRKVQRLPRYSDWAMVLTSLVLRINNVVQRVEFNLRLALSRATLVRIHCELSLEFTDLDDSSPLVHKYRSFVKELLQELESTQSLVESEKIFKTVAELKFMFRSYKAGHKQKGELNSSERENSRHTSGTDVGAAPRPMEVSAVSGRSILSSSVMGAFESARAEQQVSRLMKSQHRPPNNNTRPMRATPGSDTVQVHMVDGRMQVLQEGHYVDMQQWLDRANTIKVAPRPLQSKIPKAPSTTPNIATSGFLNSLKTGKWY